MDYQYADASVTSPGSTKVEECPSALAEDNVAVSQPSENPGEHAVASLKDIVPHVNDILEAAKSLASAARKLEKNQSEIEDAKEQAKKLQKEANEALEARLEQRQLTESRSFEEVQKDLLKMLKRLDKAVETNSEEIVKSQEAYTGLLRIITPSS